VATGQDQWVSRQLGTLLTVGTAGELTDGQLLERFATRAGDAAEQAGLLGPGRAPWTDGPARLPLRSDRPE
jgi:hypothetical protein